MRTCGWRGDVAECQRMLRVATSIIATHGRHGNLREEHADNTGMKYLELSHFGIIGCPMMIFQQLDSDNDLKYLHPLQKCQGNNCCTMVRPN
jgi:hypothetical protein